MKLLLMDGPAYQSMFESIWQSLIDLFKLMDGVWTFLNTPYVSHDFYLPNIDWSWDIVGVISQILGYTNQISKSIVMWLPYEIMNVLFPGTQTTPLSMLFGGGIFVLIAWIMVKSLFI